MSDTYQFCVKIPVEKVDILEEFKSHVAFKYGELRNVLGPELIRALEIYNIIQTLKVMDDPEFLRRVILAGINAMGADTEMEFEL